MKTIHKYACGRGRFTLELPKGAQVLSVQMQRGQPVVWALIETNNPLETRTFEIVGTGWEVDADLGLGLMPFIGTFQTEGGFVFHLFGGAPS